METVSLRPPPPDSIFKEYMRNRVFSDEGKPRNIFLPVHFLLKKGGGRANAGFKMERKEWKKKLGAPASREE